MTHLSEDAKRLKITKRKISYLKNLSEQIGRLDDVCMVILPPGYDYSSIKVEQLITGVIKNLGPEATVITVGEVVDLVHAHTWLASSMTYQLWVSLKRATPITSGANTRLPHHHFGALVHTRYKGSLHHTKTRIKYTYCPACNKTTKDYGGKKHTYNSYGTLISDIWRDIEVDLEGDLSDIIERFADLFSLEEYKEFVVLDCRMIQQDNAVPIQYRIESQQTDYAIQSALFDFMEIKEEGQSRLILGDSLEKLQILDDNSVDFAFADPPYNLKKKYNSYSDDLSIAEYFEWCDAWITELARVLRPGRTCAILNIPLWAIRHFLCMEKILKFQNWIVWDALSFPVREIMPAHYTILCFSKGPSRPLPGLIGSAGEFEVPISSEVFLPLEPLAEGFCLRAGCIHTRRSTRQNDRGPLTDLWWDIHRLKHNSRRVDHPCQLPPQLMYRLISVFTEPDEVVLDCFNGAGTTTLAAHQLKRHYIGIELAEKYHQIAQSRHEEIRRGIDPFRKMERELTEKNSPVERMPKRTYDIPKKTLQLEVRRVARELNRLPTRDDMIQYGQYPIKYYDEYFLSWGEVRAAARHDGMSEEKETQSNHNSEPKQLSLFGGKETKDDLEI